MGVPRDPPERYFFLMFSLGSIRTGNFITTVDFEWHSLFIVQALIDEFRNLCKIISVDV
jgi:hypothetical protein